MSAKAQQVILKWPEITRFKQDFSYFIPMINIRLWQNTVSIQFCNISLLERKKHKKKTFFVQNSYFYRYNLYNFAGTQMSANTPTFPTLSNVGHSYKGILDHKDNCEFLLPPHLMVSVGSHSASAPLVCPDPKCIAQTRAAARPRWHSFHPPPS